MGAYYVMLRSYTSNIYPAAVHKSPSTVLSIAHHLLITNYSPITTMNQSQPSSSRDPIQQQAITNHSSQKDSLLVVITSTLELAEKALDGVSVPGAKAAVGSILLIIKRIDV